MHIFFCVLVFSFFIWNMFSFQWPFNLEKKCIPKIKMFWQHFRNIDKYIHVQLDNEGIIFLAYFGNVSSSGTPLLMEHKQKVCLCSFASLWSPVVLARSHLMSGSTTEGKSYLPVQVCNERHYAYDSINTFGLM